MTDSERSQILKMIEDGKITAEEGLKLMQAIDASADEEIPADGFAEAAPEVIAAEPASSGAKVGENPEFAAKISRYKKLWVIPLAIGLFITFLGSVWMYNIVLSGLNGWLALALPVFFLGIALVALGAGSRTSRWIYVNVNERGKNGKKGAHIVVAFPIPLGLIQWGIQNFGHHIPDNERRITDDVMRHVFEGSALDEPLLVEVDEDDGDHVQVYIG